MANLNFLHIEMITIKNENSYKGTRIQLGNDKRDLINSMIRKLKDYNYTEISLPIIQRQEVFSGKVGQENTNMMYNFKDRGERNLVLAPEYTTIIQNLAKTHFKQQKDVKVFYVQECFRGENAQRARYRQFTQLGVEVINPTWTTREEAIIMTAMAGDLLDYDTDDYELLLNNERGLDYYTDFTFEIQHKESKLSVCGGGSYEGGVGFAIGIDRFITLNENK